MGAPETLASFYCRLLESVAAGRPFPSKLSAARGPGEQAGGWEAWMGLSPRPGTPSRALPGGLGAMLPEFDLVSQEDPSFY